MNRPVRVWRLRTTPSSLNSTTVRIALPVGRHLTWTASRRALSICWGPR